MSNGKGSKPRIKDYNKYWAEYDLIFKKNSLTTETITETKECHNCKEKKLECACLRNKCLNCGKSVGNVTFTYCDKCWDKQI